MGWLFGGQASPVYKALREGDVKWAVKQLREQPEMLTRREVGRKKNIFHLVAKRNLAEFASAVLLHLGQTGGLPEAVNATNDDGDTPLTLACAYGHSTVVELLLEMGANPSIINSKSGKNSLHISAFAGHSACVKAVLEHLQTRHLQKEGKPRFIDALSTEGFAAIHYAAFKGNEAVMRMLLAAGANMMLRIGPLAHEATWIHARAGYTPLHIAASMGNASIIRMLLSHWKAREQRGQWSSVNSGGVEDPRLAQDQASTTTYINGELLKAHATPLQVAQACKHTQLLEALTPGSPVLVMAEDTGSADSCNLRSSSSAGRLVGDSPTRMHLGDIQASLSDPSMTSSTWAQPRTSLNGNKQATSASYEQPYSSNQALASRALAAVALDCSDSSDESLLSSGHVRGPASAATHHQTSLLRKGPQGSLVTAAATGGFRSKGSSPRDHEPVDTWGEGTGNTSSTHSKSNTCGTAAPGSTTPPDSPAVRPIAKLSDSSKGSIIKGVLTGFDSRQSDSGSARNQLSQGSKGSAAEGSNGGITDRGMIRTPWGGRPSTNYSGSGSPFPLAKVSQGGWVPDLPVPRKFTPGSRQASASQVEMGPMTSSPSSLPHASATLRASAPSLNFNGDTPEMGEGVPCKSMVGSELHRSCSERVPPYPLEPVVPQGPRPPTRQASNTTQGLTGTDKDPNSRSSDSTNRPFSRGTTALRTSSTIDTLPTTGSILGAVAPHTIGTTPASPVAGSLAAKATVQGRFTLSGTIMGVGSGSPQHINDQQRVPANDVRKAYSLDNQVYRTFSNSLYGDSGDGDDVATGHGGHTMGGHTSGGHTHTISVTHNSDWTLASGLDAAALSLNTSMTRQAMAAAAHAPAPRPPTLDQRNGIGSRDASMGKPVPRRGTRSDSGAVLQSSNTAGTETFSASNRGPTAGLPRATAKAAGEMSSFHKLSHVSEGFEYDVLDRLSYADACDARPSNGPGATGKQGPSALHTLLPFARAHV